MEFLVICNLIAGLLICIFSLIFCYCDIVKRRVSLSLFNGIFCILLAWFALEYIWLMLTVNLTYIIMLITALGLPFLLWYFGKGKFGAVDARWISIIMLLVPSLYYQLLFITVLVITTLFVIFISKFVTKTYDTFDENGEQRYAPEMVAIFLAYIISLCLVAVLGFV